MLLKKAHVTLHSATRTLNAHCCPQHGVSIGEKSDEGDLEDTIRRCVREEMQLFRGSGPQNLLNRTRSMIQAATTSAAQEIRTHLNVTDNTLNTTNSTDAATRSQVGAKRQTVPGHPFRPLSTSNKRKKSQKQLPPIAKSVYLFDCLHQLQSESDDKLEVREPKDTFPFSESKIVIKGEFDLTPGSTEDEIRAELIEVFKSKIPTIAKHDFSFVKRERNVVTLPVTKSGHKWDFLHVKNLCGQGRLYVMLNTSKEDLLQSGNIDDGFELCVTNPSPPIRTCGPSQSLPQTNVPSLPTTSQRYPLNVHAAHCSTVQSTTHERHNTRSVCDTARPGSSLQQDHARSQMSSSQKTTSFTADESQIQALTTIFPDVPEDEIRRTLYQYGSVAVAANVLSDNQFVEMLEELDDDLPSGIIDSDPKTVSDVLLNLKRKGMKLHSKKLRVDEDDLVSDAFCYYKNPDFDPSSHRELHRQSC